MPTVITAISSSETEGFVAGTLFTQGWSVIFRAIDWASLEHFVSTNQDAARGALLLFASDLPGISKEKVDSITPQLRQTIGFSTDKQQKSEFVNLHEVPQSITDLVTLVRGFVRAPLLRGQLSLVEISQDHAGEINDFMDRAADNFDYIIVDLGSISGLSNRLTDRRWTSTMTTWCCDQGDELMIVSRADQLGAHRLAQVVELLQNTSVRASLSFVMNMKASGKRGDSEQAKFLSNTAPLKPIRVRSIAKDSRAIMAAEDEHATLVETNVRSNVRKAIANLARELES